MYDIRYSLARAKKAVACHHHKRSSKMTMLQVTLGSLQVTLGGAKLLCPKNPLKQLATSPSPPSNGKFFHYFEYLYIYIQIHVHVHIDASVSHKKTLISLITSESQLPFFNPPRLLQGFPHLCCSSQAVESMKMLSNHGIKIRPVTVGKTCIWGVCSGGC